MVPRIVQFTEAESKAVVTMGWRKDNGEFLFNGYRVSVWNDENVLEINNGDHCKTI